MSLIDEIEEAAYLVSAVEDLHVSLEDAQRVAIDQMNSIEGSEANEIASAYQRLGTERNSRRCAGLWKEYADRLKTESWNAE